MHASTFSENALAMRAGLAVLHCAELEGLGQRSTELGEFLRSQLRTRLSRFEIVRDVRGVGLFNAVEFQAPSSFGLKMLYAAFTRAHPGLFGQMVIRSLFENHHVLCQMAGNNYLAIKALPPLTISAEQAAAFASAMETVCRTVVSERTKFWSQGIKIAARAFGPKADGSSGPS